MELEPKKKLNFLDFCLCCTKKTIAESVNVVASVPCKGSLWAAGSPHLVSHRVYMGRVHVRKLGCNAVSSIFGQGVSNVSYTPGVYVGGRLKYNFDGMLSGLVGFKDGLG